MTCPIHPRYQAIRKPTSRKRDCVCRSIWKNKQAMIERSYMRLLCAIFQIEPKPEHRGPLVFK